jgi:hypothetical protein
MDCAAPKFERVRGHVHEIGHSDLKLVDSVKIGLQSKSIGLWKSLDMAKLPWIHAIIFTIIRMSHAQSNVPRSITQNGMGTRLAFGNF